MLIRYGINSARYALKVSSRRSQQACIVASGVVTRGLATPSYSQRASVRAHRVVHAATPRSSSCITSLSSSLSSITTLSSRRQAVSCQQQRHLSIASIFSSIMSATSSTGSSVTPPIGSSVAPPVVPPPSTPRIPSDVLNQPPAVPPSNASEKIIDMATPIVDGSSSGPSLLNLDPTAIAASQKLGVVGLPAPADQWANVTWAQDMFAYLHETTGQPWWVCIAAVTIVVRCCTFPITLYSMRKGPRMAAANIELTARLASTKRAITEHTQAGNVDKAKELRLQQTTIMREVFAKYKANPMAMMGGFTLIPVFMTGFFALEKLAARYDLSTGGFGWITDLSVADPYFIMPVISAGTMLLMVELGVDPNTGERTALKNPMIVKVFRGLTVVSFAVTYSFPAALFIYWTTSNFFSLGQSFLTRQKAVRRILGIPTIEQVVAEVTAKNVSGTTTEAVVINTNRRSRTNITRVADEYIKSQGKDVTSNYSSAPPPKK